MDSEKRLILQLGLFFSWLLSFPLYGPLLLKLMATVNAPPLPLDVFSLAHAAGLLGCGWLLHRWPVKQGLALASRAAVTLCLLASAGIIIAPSSFWPYLLITAGIAAALYILLWARQFIACVPHERRFIVMIYIMLFANILYEVNMILAPLLTVYAMLAAVTVILGGTLLLLTPAQPQTSGAAIAFPAIAGNQAYTSLASQQPDNPAGPNPSWLFMLIFGLLVLAFYITGGFYYAAILPHVTLPGEADRFYSDVPYIIALVGCGFFTPRFRARFLLVFAIAIMGISFSLLPLIPDAAKYWVSFTLIQIAFAAMDLFVWVTLAELSTTSNVALNYGWGLGMNVMGLFLGTSIVNLLINSVEDLLLSTALIAAVFLFVTMFGQARFYDLFPQPWSKLSPVKPSFYPEHHATATAKPVKAPPLTLAALTGAKLTSRELEIANLLLKGLSNKEIEDILNIASGTLKTHLSHIYRKTGATSRQKLILMAKQTIDCQEGDSA